MGHGASHLYGVHELGELLKAFKSLIPHILAVLGFIIQVNSCK
jgi:hypothetical protein